ncbi:hypothetical protein KKC45_01910 [Patescibacteria group bacterium]|nr:hypothetical protein [Patescibacteria group bacterium]
MILEMTRTIILAVGWPVLIAGSVYLVFQGRKVYGMVKDSLVGKITKALVVTMLVEMYSLGIITTMYMLDNINAVRWGVLVFALWFIVFIWTIKTIRAAQKEIAHMAGDSN